MRVPRAVHLSITSPLWSRVLAAAVHSEEEADRESGGKYNVCGFSVLSLLLELLPGIKGQVLGYDLWQEDGTESAVSFAAMALY